MTTPNIIIYAIPGSQFVFKVLAALQSRNIPHYIKDVPLDISARKKVIPSSGILVPEMQVGLSKTDRIIISDSEKILHWLDDNKNTNYYYNNNKDVCELSERASTKTLAAMVWYYNWVNDTGYKNSMQRTISTNKNIIPSYIFCFREYLVDMAVSSLRTKHKKLVLSTLEEEELPNDNQLLLSLDEEYMYNKLITELKFFQDLLLVRTTNEQQQQQYMIPTSVISNLSSSATDDTSITTIPCAIDFSVYAQVERLIGNGGDVTIYAAVPDLVNNNELQPLWAWYKHMKELIPVQFLNKRLPKNINDELFSSL